MKTHLVEALRKGKIAARQNLIPGVVLQVIAVTLVLCYYNIDRFQYLLDIIGTWNIEFSPWFAVGMTMIFGGAIPLVIEAIRAIRRGLPQRTIRQVAFTLLLWGFNGALTAWFYQLQDVIFGSELTFWTVLKKVMVDQFVWVPIYVVPVFTLSFLWRDEHFSTANTQAALRRKTFLSRGLPLMISNWAVWIPAVSIVYAFPLALQMILMNLILVFWSLILTIFVSD